ncbi:hypothetical protein [Spirosoma sp. KNUC1025]|uniref:hypothetical protein n=1 Tax=Spirosoma sp. KNUC1025 TaxID=2894082 RepID=UPI001E2EFBDB|nr:hypothetical protein [Spirosoma sp. KNUC1025]UFH57634.1 hypothetical protein LN737_30575 [Spirosoma sp. KNUC1025]
MKTSDKLLIGSLVLGLLTLVGSTMALRAEHDTIDFNDPFYGYTSTPVKPFSILKIEGNPSGILPQGTAPIGSNGITENPYDSYTTLGIQVGTSFEIRTPKANTIKFIHRSVGDTLLIRYEHEFYARRISADEAFAAPPFAYIIAPAIRQLIASRTTCKLTGLKAETISIQATNARLLLSHSLINQLTSTAQTGSILQISATTHIHAATITSRDSSSFRADGSGFDALKLQNDSTAILKLPASLLTKLR